MIADLRAVPSDVPLEADICIIGGGPAGIVIASQFISSPHRVILLESGGFRPEANVQQLYSGQSVGETYFRGLDECRSRYFGGSSNCWVGICTPLNPLDLEKRSWVPWSGWPFDFGELAPYLRRSHSVCGTGPYIYDARAWNLMGIAPEGFSSERFDPFVWHYNKRSNAAGIEFGKRFRSELRQARNVQVLLHANATELLTDSHGRGIERVRVRTLNGQSRQIRSKLFVLACGGIENARILLASNSHYPNGLGNQRDMVGRFFQEHLEVPCATLTVSETRSVAARYSQLTKAGQSFCLPGLALAPAAQALHQTLNGSISLDPFYGQESPLIVFQNLISELNSRRISRQTFNRMWKVTRGSRKLAREAWRHFVHGDRPPGDSDKFVIYARVEQAPNPDSRITLSRDRDELGMRRVILDWRTTPLDRRAIRLLAAFAGEEFGRLGMGQVTPAEWLPSEQWPASLVGGNHHMGTTRMSDDESTGVVDTNCRIHGLHGLYVAGSSVFPTSGYANPTLTIIAMALRLADHLRDALVPKLEPIITETKEGNLPVATAAAPLPTKVGAIMRALQSARGLPPSEHQRSKAAN